MGRSGLRMEEKNVLVRGLRAGLTWDEAKAPLTAIDAAALEGWKAWAHAEAAKNAPVEAKVEMTFSKEEVREMVDEAMSAARNEITTLKEQVATLAKEKATALAEITTLKEQLDFLTEPDQKSGKQKR